MSKKDHRLNKRLTEDELNYLEDCLSDHRLKQQERRKLEDFYTKTSEKHGFDAFGRFTNYSEMGMERTTFEIQNELGDGSNYNFIQKDEGDKLTLVDKLGEKECEPVILTLDEVNWSDYFEMCNKLEIDPNSYGYYAGLTYSDEFNELMKNHPWLLEHYIEHAVFGQPTDRDKKIARTHVKKWFYSYNRELGSTSTLVRPIDLYRKKGITSMGGGVFSKIFFDKNLK